MKISTLASAAALAVLLIGGVAYAAEGNATTPATTDTPAATPAPTDPKAAECAQKADAQHLHKKKRKKFIAECMKGS